MEALTGLTDESAPQLYKTAGDLYRLKYVFLARFPGLSDPEEVEKEMPAVLEAFGGLWGEEPEQQKVEPPQITWEVERINNYPADVEGVFLEILREESRKVGS